MSEHSIDIGLVAASHRVHTWLCEYERLKSADKDAIYIVNGYELRVSDLKRLVDKMNEFLGGELP